MTKQIQLGKCGLVALIDDAFPNDCHWFFDGRYVYRRSSTCRGPYKKIYLHREVMQTPKGFDTDHINGNKLDNRRENLRISSRSENNMNQKKTRGVSKYKGVCWHKQRSKWKAEIKLNGIKKHLGLFTSEEAAAEAYDQAAKELFGNFAKTNLL